MQISKTTQRQIEELTRIVGLTSIGRSLVERIVAEAAHEAASAAVASCRRIAADMLTEQRSRFYGGLRRASSKQN
jgi:hypothetical protein